MRHIEHEVIGWYEVENDNDLITLHQFYELVKPGLVVGSLLMFTSPATCYASELKVALKTKAFETYYEQLPVPTSLIIEEIIRCAPEVNRQIIHEAIEQTSRLRIETQVVPIMTEPVKSVVLRLRAGFVPQALAVVGTLIGLASGGGGAVPAIVSVINQVIKSVKKPEPEPEPDSWLPDIPGGPGVLPVLALIALYTSNKKFKRSVNKHILRMKEEPEKPTFWQWYLVASRNFGEPFAYVNLVVWITFITLISKRFFPDGLISKTFDFNTEIIKGFVGKIQDRYDEMWQMHKARASKDEKTMDKLRDKYHALALETNNLKNDLKHSKHSYENCLNTNIYMKEKCENDLKTYSRTLLEEIIKMPNVIASKISASMRNVAFPATDSDSWEQWLSARVGQGLTFDQEHQKANTHATFAGERHRVPLGAALQLVGTGVSKAVVKMGSNLAENFGYITGGVAHTVVVFFSNGSFSEGKMYIETDPKVP
jgi:hypothetical protein